MARRREPRSPVLQLRTLLDELGPELRRRLPLILAGTAIAGIADMLAIGSVIPLTTALAKAPGGGRASLLLLGFLGLVAVAGALRLWLRNAGAVFALQVGRRLHRLVYRRVLGQDFAAHSRFHSSRAVAALQKVDMVADTVVAPLIDAVGGLVVAILLAGLTLAVAPIPAAVTAFLLIALYGLLSLAMRGRLARTQHHYADAYDERVRLVQDSLGSIRDLIIDDLRADAIAAFDQSTDRLTRARTDYQWLASAPRTVIETLGTMALALVALILAQRAGGLAAAAPLLGFLALTAVRLLPIAGSLQRSWTLVVANRGMIDDLHDLLALPPPPPPAILPPLPIRQALTIRDVAFHHAQGERPLFDGLSLSLAPGDRVALTGATGSGKSTLLDLMMGLLRPDRGAVLLDGRPLTGETLRRWHRTIAHVSPAAWLVDDTIAANIALSRRGDPIDPDAVRACAEQAMLGGFLGRLADGLDTRVGERGARISSGERQRIAIARALYKGAPILFLDEATGALDPETEAAVMERLFAERTRTLVIATHRPAVAERCDVEWRIEDGLVTVSGGGGQAG